MIHNNHESEEICGVSGWSSPLSRQRFCSFLCWVVHDVQLQLRGNVVLQRGAARRLPAWQQVDAIARHQFSDIAPHADLPGSGRVGVHLGRVDHGMALGPQLGGGRVKCGEVETPASLSWGRRRRFS